MQTLVDLARRPRPLSVESDPLLLKAASFEKHPSFADALEAYTIKFVEFRQRASLINKVVSYHARWRVASYLMYLAADREMFGPEGGATYGRLLDMCKRPPEIGKRSLVTLLALLQVSGMITAKRGMTDGRSRVYAPTPRMQEFMVPWLTYATATLDLLEPEQRRAHALATDADYRDKFFISSGRWHAISTPLVDRLPKYTAFFGGRDGAGAVLLALMIAQLGGTRIVSRAEIGARFWLSKSQVTAVLREGEALGYFAIDAKGIPGMTAHLHADFRRWVALELAFYALHMPGQPVQS